MADDDPFRTLGLDADASDVDVRAAYRRLAQLHHPDHNGGSRESALRFAEIQEAYARVRLARATAAPAAATTEGEASAGRADSAGHEATGEEATADRSVEARIAAMEQEVKTASAARERAAREAERARAQAAAAAYSRAEATQRPTDEELGYITTDDSFAKILADLTDEVGARFAEAHEADGHDPAQTPPRRPRSIADWIDELGSRLTGERRQTDSTRDRAGGHQTTSDPTQKDRDDHPR